MSKTCEDNKLKSSVLFGNGFNRLSSNFVTWDDLLVKLQGDHGFVSKTTPNTMIYERIFLNRLRKHNHGVIDIDSVEIEIKNEIAHALQNQGSNDLYKKIIALQIDNYMTTNYDHAFKKSFDDSYNFINGSTEKVYSIRRHTTFHNKDNPTRKIWNIHGEIDYPVTIKLGLDHYCGSIGKIDSYIKGNYTFSNNEKTIKTTSIKEKLISGDFDSHSWVELFFSSNVHIIGLSLDFSETDLWWILNKRARLNSTGLVKNKVFFYVSENFDDEKEALLSSLGVQVIKSPVNEGDYYEFYNSAILKIQENVTNYDR